MSPHVEGEKVHENTLEERMMKAKEKMATEPSFGGEEREQHLVPDLPTPPRFLYQARSIFLVSPFKRRESCRCGVAVNERSAGWVMSQRAKKGGRAPFVDRARPYAMDAGGNYAPTRSKSTTGREVNYTK